jgi:hypothetical protein
MTRVFSSTEDFCRVGAVGFASDFFAISGVLEGGGKRKAFWPVRGANLDTNSHAVPTAVLLRKIRVE